MFKLINYAFHLFKINMDHINTRCILIYPTSKNGFSFNALRKWMDNQKKRELLYF